MPFCTHCGNSIGSSDRFCSHCGTGQAQPSGEPDAQEQAAQPAPPPPPPGAGPRPGLQPHIAALLCYVPGLGWIASVIFLTLDQYRLQRYVRFHALQGLFLFVATFVVQALWGSPLAWMTPGVVHMRHFDLRSVIELAVVIIQVVGMVKCFKREDFHLPVLGELAARSMA